ncbi:putative leucine-rich repeat receptor-like protein kinase At2g19210 [Triticum urartu]|uniref:putative leucine-rich repeat receptor-like protein kinase At2g19210 n=1 Tax=Triticum urartu TaxID=4572 RepID=UPI002044620C|nr:putative leucine-rich repeat receptor-like protein kinase At2g19210 [Triticum urartu]
MATTPWLLLLCLAAAASSGALQARAQPDNKGFISIDCGFPGTTSYIDSTTELSYAPDAAFTDTGSSHNISVEYMKPQLLLSKRYHDLRSFPDGTRNCYTLRSLVPGLKYLLRATFFYGNYDGLDRIPIFDLHIGVNFWRVVNITNMGYALQLEALVVVPDDFVQVCLINTGAGTPFISGLDLRPLKKTMYPQVTATQGLVLMTRLNFGPRDDSTFVRYPDDPYDRIWTPWINTKIWTVISTKKRVQSIDNDVFEAPTAVMQTAIRPRDVTKNIEFSWDPEPQPNDPSPGYIAIMHFSELQILPINAVRQFYVNLNSELWYPSGFTPTYLYIGATYNNLPSRHNRYNVSINATSNSTLPPIINGVEIFSVISTTNLSTYSQDVSAIMAIKTKYQVQKNWMGDPCIPKTMAWERLTCGYEVTTPHRIKAVDLSVTGLSGDITSSFINLKALQYLNLSNNKLTGSIPDALSQLPSLTIIDLSGNQLSGSIPPGLLKRVQDGSLNFRYENNPNICASDNSCQSAPKRNNKLAIYIVVPLLVVVVMVSLAIVIFFLVRRRQQGDVNYMLVNGDRGGCSLQLENRRFTYKQLDMITKGFKRILGRGGFGIVYHGFLEDDTEVAVKLRSRTSKQGVNVFLAEAQILTQIHHKNLVTMIGYCKDGKDMALVYEYMSEGTLQEHIIGRDDNGEGLLDWRQRLRIALESAKGLEYLHTGCSPPLIHMDVKPTNILLNASLEAKIADFGMSKAFKHDKDTHVSTNTLVGTYGYVDPEYLATMQPTTKSDVYSFGVVLLELVTGRPAILPESPMPISIIHWVRSQLAEGNIESVVDACMHGCYDVNSVWKVANIALECTTQVSVERPTINDVVVQLQECLKLEDCYARSDMSGGLYIGSGSHDPNLNNESQDSVTSEMEYVSRRMATRTTDPVAR